MCPDQGRARTAQRFDTYDIPVVRSGFVFFVKINETVAVMVTEDYSYTNYKVIDPSKMSVMYYSGWEGIESNTVVSTVPELYMLCGRVWGKSCWDWLRKLNLSRTDQIWVTMSTKYL